MSVVEQPKETTFEIGCRYIFDPPLLRSCWLVNGSPKRWTHVFSRATCEARLEDGTFFFTGWTDDGGADEYRFIVTEYSLRYAKRFRPTLAAVSTK